MINFKKSISFFFFLRLAACYTSTAFEGRLEHRQGSGIGYKEQYSKVELYHAFENQAFQPFIDLRYLILNEAKQGANFGMGLGYQFSQENRLSAYAYFDLTESKTNHLFNQVMGGFSYTHPLIFSKKDWGGIACYLNGYFPMKSMEKRVSSPSFSRFKGYHLLIEQINRYALSGSNLEVGYLSNTWRNWNLYAAGSAYYFKRSDLHAFGGYGKLRFAYNDLISGEILVSGDQIFGTNVSGTIGIRIPLGKRGMQAVKKRRYCPHKSRPIERLEPIVLKRHKKEEVAKDASGVPLNFIFINNLSGSQGTFEDPFPTLAQAQNASRIGDFIYVFPGDGTTRGMDVGFIMKTGQTLAGSGTPLPVSTHKGVVIIPALTLTGPQIANNIGNGVTLATNCSVNGIDVVGSLISGFFYPLFEEGISTVTMNHCSAKDAVDAGFVFASFGSSHLTLVFNRCSAERNTEGGFLIASAEDSSLNVSFSRCSASHDRRSGFSITSDDMSQLTALFTQCSSTDSNRNSGFSFSSISASQMTVSLNHSSANSNGAIASPEGNGFTFLSVGTSQLTASFNQCFSNNNRNSGFNFTSLSASQMSVLLNQSSADNNGVIGSPERNGFSIISDAISQLTASFDRCFSNNNENNGFDINNAGHPVSSLEGTFNDCMATANGGSSFNLIDTTNGGTFTIPSDATLDYDF